MALMLWNMMIMANEPCQPIMNKTGILFDMDNTFHAIYAIGDENGR